MSAWTGREPGTWDWKVEEGLHPHYFARVEAEGLSYSWEIRGPFCGHDEVGKQTWADFLEVGPPAELQMPGWIAAQIRAYALAPRE